MRTAFDVKKSLAQYMAEVLGEQWTVTIDGEQGARSAPLLSVEQAGPALTTSEPHEAKLTMPLVLTMEPARAGTGVEAAQIAGELEEVCFQAFAVGVNYGRPSRVPLWDFSVSPPKRSALDFARVQDWQPQTRNDVNDDRSVAVTCSVRLTWRRAARPFVEGPLTVGVSVVEEVD